MATGQLPSDLKILETEMKVTKQKLDSTSFWICMTYFATLLGLGLHMSAPGPILKDIEEQVHLNLSVVSYIFSTRAIGYVIGSIIGGYIIDKYQKIYSTKLSKHILLKVSPHIIYFLCVLIANISMIIIPFLHNFVMIMILFSITGIAFGQLDTYSNVFLLALFDTDNENDASVKPYMQFLHFMFALGAFISPLFIQLSFHLTHHYTLSMLIFGIVNTLAALPLIFLPTPIRKNVINNNSTTLMTLSSEIEMGHIENDQDNNCDVVDDEDIVIELKLHDQITNNKYLEYVIMFVFALFFAICVGGEVSYGGYVATYCINYLNTNKSVGRYMSSVFWLGLSVGRLSAVFISNKLKTFHMLLLDLLGLLIGNIILMIFNKIVLMAYIASFVYGFGMASMFPCAFLYGEETITVTGKFASMMVLGASIGEFIIPTLLGNIMHVITDKAFETYMFILTIIMASTLAMIVCLRKKKSMIL